LAAFWLLGRRSAELAFYAFLLAAARRLIRPAGAPALGAICSLTHFLPVIEEVLTSRVHPDYFRYLRQKMERSMRQ
jgi:hypothetical protein